MTSALHFLRRYPTLAAGGLLLLMLVSIALFAPWLGTQDPTQIEPLYRTRVPSAQFWFGTDLLGRDVYSRVLYGARVSLTVGFSVAALSTVAGAVIGVIAGFVRWLDVVIMRVMDGFMSIPTILLAIALIALWHESMRTVIAAITIVEIPRVVRLVRGVVLSLREQAFVEAAVTAGASPWRIMYRHILPNTLAALVVQGTYILGVSILAEASLSFVGAGVPPATPSWGNIMAEGRALWQIRPHLIAFPAAFLSLTILSVNMLGDGLRDALDPRMSKGD
jgi:peptide/nickel transport system permease protein